jgi:hypothetical protein
MSRQIQGRDVKFIFQPGVLVKPDGMIPAGTMNKYECFFGSLPLALAGPAGHFKSVDVLNMDHMRLDSERLMGLTIITDSSNSANKD